MKTPTKKRPKVKVGNSTGVGWIIGHSGPVTLDLASTEASIRESVAANLIDRDVVVAKGADAASFLHGQLSQNVERLTVGESAMTFLLHPQGRVAAWGRISRVGEEEFWFDVDSGFGEDAAARLQRFLLRVKCSIEFETWPMVQFRGLSVESPASPAADSHVLVAGIGSNQVGFDLLGPSAALPNGLDAGDPMAFEAQRIQLGWPAMGAEIGESTIPAEVGVVDDSADFTKGCYVGQELVARVDSRGSNTPRKMHRVSGSGVSPSLGSELTVGGEPIGTLTSAANRSDQTWIGLASIKRAAETPCDADLAGSAVHVEAAG